MRERRAGDEVADRVDALDRRAQRAVDLDQAAVVELDARFVEPERLDVRPAAGGDDEVVDLAGLVAVGERDLVVAALDVLDRRAGVDLDVLLGEAAAGDLGDVGVLGREHAVERLEEQDLGAEAAVGGGDLRAGRARAEHRELSSGSSSSAHASSVPITRPPNCVPGTGLGTEPVARMIAFDA